MFDTFKSSECTAQAEIEPYRSSHWKCSVKKVFLKISQNSLENTFARVSFLIKLQARVSFLIKLRTSTLLKKRLWHTCFLVNFAKLSRTSISQNTSGGCFWPYAHSQNILIFQALLSLAFVVSLSLWKKQCNGLTYIFMLLSEKFGSLSALMYNAPK